MTPLIASQFLASLLVIALCGLALGLGVLLGGTPLTGACGRRGTSLDGCAGCPNRGRTHHCPSDPEKT